jgi:catechol 2,3-dioxygenase-like lactoylglutathione lyase family enzyme
MNFQSVVINVADLDRSIEFYSEVLGFSLLSREEQLASLNAPETDRPQVIVLRALGGDRLGGARHIGVRAFLMEVEPVEQLERIARDLESRRLLVARRDHGADWTAVSGRDPDGVTVVITSRSGEGQISLDSWRTLDDFLYGIGE